MAPRPGFERTFNFSVDAALLRELGERLVGKPGVALAELIKNAYDADAGLVRITFDREGDVITVEDDGHGMTPAEFEQFFMRVGTTHKVEKRFSKRFRRPLTGSKGVGRLAVQFLAREMEIETMPKESAPTPSALGIHGLIAWEDAARSGNLIEATLAYELVGEIAGLPSGSRNGTRLKLKGLRHEWDDKDLRSTAAEVWMLRPPFEVIGRRTAVGDDPGLDIAFMANESNMMEAAGGVLDAIYDLWTAKVTGVYDDGRARYIVERPDGGRWSVDHEFVAAPDAYLHHASFVIRIYKLQYRQPQGILVAVAREYMSRWGGVQVLDTEFRLPFYGNKENDWLGLEQDHAHRLSLSKLLPAKLNVPGGMTNLPTSTRMLGAVEVDSNAEAKRHATPRKRAGALTLQVTRDRLIDNEAHHELTRFARFGIDLYAVDEGRMKQVERERQRETDRLVPEVEDALAILETHRGAVPPPAFDELKTALMKVELRGKHLEEDRRADVGLLASLATAGMATLAYRHEIEKVLSALEAAALRLAQTEPKLAKDIDRTLARAREIDALFEFVADAESREARDRYRARALIESTVKHLEFLAPHGLDVDISGVAEDMRLPEGTHAEWHALVQNVLTNALHAVLDVNTRRIVVSSEVSSRRDRLIAVEDTGVGVDLDKAEGLFEPFSRGGSITTERRRRGYGGTGLGLTIVRMVANNLGCMVRFARPTEGFSTRFEITWRER